MKRSSSPSIRKWLIPALAFLTLIGLFVSRVSNYLTTDRPELNSEIVRRLAQANANWRRGTEKRDAFESHPCFLNNTGACRPMTLWDYFSPTFDCPYNTERIGKVADGGKWVCGFEMIALRPSCLVYSFGIAGDSSFEEEVLARTNCTLRMWDPTPNVATELTARFPGRAFFESAGLKGENVGNFRTLKSLLEGNKDTFVDILKMDVEGSEFESLLAAITDYPLRLPFGQLQVEFHIGGETDRAQYNERKLFFSNLEEAGLRIFRNEPNLFAPGVYYEYSFINIKADMFMIP